MKTSIEISDRDMDFLLYALAMAAEYFDTVRDAHTDSLFGGPTRGYKRVHDEAIRDRRRALRMREKLKARRHSP